MWKDLEKGDLEQLLLGIRNIIDKLSVESTIVPSDILSIIDPILLSEVKSFLSRVLKIPEFLLEMEGIKSTTEILQAFQNWEKQILSHISLQEHPDNLPELLYGQREFGCVYVPTELLKHIYYLGEIVSEFLKTKNQETGDQINKQMLEVMIQSSQWVEYSKRKWGIMPHAELTIVSPLTQKEIETAKPDEETDPPF